MPPFNERWILVFLPLWSLCAQQRPAFVARYWNSSHWKPNGMIVVVARNQLQKLLEWIRWGTTKLPACYLEQVVLSSMSGNKKKGSWSTHTSCTWKWATICVWDFSLHSLLLLFGFSKDSGGLAKRESKLQIEPQKWASFRDTCNNRFLCWPKSIKIDSYYRIPKRFTSQRASNHLLLSWQARNWLWKHQASRGRKKQLFAAFNIVVGWDQS